MHLQHDLRDGVVVLVVAGRVLADDARVLGRAASAALSHRPRGVVVSLAEAGHVDGLLSGELVAAACDGGWPSPRLRVSGAAPELADALRGIPVHASLSDALAHVDDRPDRHHERVALTYGPEGPAQARAAVLAVAGRLGLAPLADDLALVVSELVTNAVLHARPPLELEIDVEDGGVTLVVRDGAPDPPRPRGAGPSAEGGRGLHLVDELSQATGVAPDPPGKRVWAALGHRAPRMGAPG